MNNKFTAVLLLLLVVSQGYINYRITEVQKAQVGLTYLMTLQDKGQSLLQSMIAKRHSSSGSALFGTGSNYVSTTGVVHE